MINRIVNIALSIATAAFTVSASLLTVNWVNCVGSKGGKPCESALTRTVDEWKDFGTTALALGFNIIRQQTSKP